MKSSNIFVYIELTKFTSGLSLDMETVKADLLAQHAYFNIIPSKLFSEYLAPDWESLCARVSHLGPINDESRQITTNAFKNTIRNMSDQECFEVANQLVELYKKVAAEFN